jgi:hypothetical protein
MYDLLTTTELTVLQSMLFEATEAAYLLVDAKEADPSWFGRYHPYHQDLGNLFIEAGMELLERLDEDAKVA